MAYRARSFTLCDTDASLTEALAELQASSAVILDCEGLNLGTRGGSLSLISLRGATPISNKAFIIDVVSLDVTSLRPLFDLIESSAVTKVVFDGRMDFNAFYHEYGVIMRQVVDLQLADLRSRVLRGEDEEDQLNRLSPYLPRDEVLAHRTHYLQVQRLTGLDQCLREHKVPGAGTKMKCMMHAYEFHHSNLRKHLQWLMNYG
jgi:exonuclease 3'-5' domain-containing protein 1